MVKIKIGVKVGMPEKARPEYSRVALAEKVRDYMEVCESDAESSYHWNYLKCLYKKLNSMPRLPVEYIDLMEDLTEFMIKYAGQDSGDNQLQLEGKDIFRYRD